MRTITHIIGKVLTEKATNLERNQVYMFEVDVKSTKTQIAEAVSALYGERPLTVRVVTRPPQTRRVGKARREVHTAVRKLAYVHMKNPLKALTKV